MEKSSPKLTLKAQALVLQAEGYYELGMNEDAWSTLDELSSDLKTSLEVLRFRLKILMQAEKFKEGVILGESLCKAYPDHEWIFIHTAYCLHELKQTVEAKERLLSGPESLRKKAIFYYNLGCYEAQLGSLDEARANVQKSIIMDQEYKKLAMDDPDLVPIFRLSKDEFQ